jgi:hypothetical protein
MLQQNACVKEVFTFHCDKCVIVGRHRAGLMGEPAGQMAGALKHYWNKSELLY